MHPSTVVLYLFAFLTVVNAYAIPIKRIKIQSTEISALHRRHARFFKRDPQPSPSVQVVTQYLTMTMTSVPSSTASVQSTSSSAAPASSASAASCLFLHPPPPPQLHPVYIGFLLRHLHRFQLIAFSSGGRDDITLAHASGIDGFALNSGTDDWQPARVADAYEAAKESGLDFKLFISLDMTVFPCGSPDNAQTIRSFIAPYLDHPNQLKYDSRAFNQFVNSGDLQGKIMFVPSFFVDPTKFGDFADVMDGDFNWNSGWPIELTTSFAQTLLNNNTNNNVDTSGLRVAAVDTVSSGLDALRTSLGQLQSAFSKLIGSTDSDEQHLNSLKSLPGGLARRDGSSQRVYMAAVSPWFFTHYGQDSFNKNFIYVSDQHLYAKRWESLIANRDQFDIVQVLTWNDYGESHYVGPIKGAQPNSQSWTDGMDHTGWLNMTAYYANAFKTGSFPDIEKDQIYMWSRPHPSQATAQDPVGQPANFELTEDTVWAVVMTTAPSTVVLSTSDTNTQSFNVQAGVTKLSIPISAGGTMQGTIQRGGKTVVQLKPITLLSRVVPRRITLMRLWQVRAHSR
ncbi:glycosyl hydrolase family 71-domain-containing protein [Cyathus striatus]|nr:glycosyl hydrolase family 71-domain-containing protein [Cyathus striatus]